MTRSPKEDFQRDKQRLAKLRLLLDDADIQAALLAAFNQLCWSLPGSDNPQAGWNANCRRHGAKSLIEELEGLTTEPKPRVGLNQNLE